MAQHLEAAYRVDTEVRIREGKAPAGGSHLAATDIVEGVVFERGAVRVTAFEVDHGPMRPAFGYRVDYAGRAVVLSGDTRFSLNLIAHAEGIDLLIHEVAAATERGPGQPTNVPALSSATIPHQTAPGWSSVVFTPGSRRILTSCCFPEFVRPTWCH